MFTGIIEKTGKIRSVSAKAKTTVLFIETPFKNLKRGSSLAVNGVCLTVVNGKRGVYAFNLLNETKKRSNLSRAAAGSLVNLERPLLPSGRLEGHFVLGHVDGTGKILKVVSKGREKSFLVGYAKALKPYLFEKGSVGVDGMSLTIGKITPAGFWIHLIPHTLKKTIAKHYAVGAVVNLEADILLKLARKIFR